MNKLTLSDSREIKKVTSIFIVVFAVIGLALLLKSFAATTFSSFEPETGTLTGGVSKISDPNASGGAYIQLGTNATSDMPIGDIAGTPWKQILTEDFTKTAATGSWDNQCDASKIVYTGDTGAKWRSYPRGIKACPGSDFKDTYQHREYRGDKVLSVHDGYLDFWLHTVDGHPAGANPGPLLPSGITYQTYGRYSAKIKQTTTNLSDYHQAWLLWPQNDGDWQCAESDFPESGMSGTTITAFAHYGCSGSQDEYNKTVDKTQWHIYTQEWLPGRRNFYVDGVLIGSSTNQVYASQERWQFQTETETDCDLITPANCTQDGHLLVDWAVVYKYQF